VTRILCAVPVLAVVVALPGRAEMFGPGFQPCGKKTSTVEVVDCVQAKTNVADQRLNAAYKALPSSDRRQSTPTATRSATSMGPIPGRQLRILRSAGRINPARAGSRMPPLDDGRPGA
jgi:uncharacterized protein YecT (DUF1311 family)